MNRNERPFVERLPPEVVINEIRWLSFFQEKLLGEYYDQGLRGDDLRSWKASGEFTYRHYESYKWLVQEKHVDLKLAIRALDGLEDDHLDVLQNKAFANYRKFVAASPNQTVTDKEAKNIIVGLGPIGLADVLEFARNDSKHRKIIAFTDRSEYTRKQVIKIEQEDLDYVQSFVGVRKTNKLFLHDKFQRDFDRMRNDHVISFQTKELEKLLADELKPYQEQGVLEIIDISDPNNKIKKIDRLAHTVELASGRVISLNMLVETDGAGHKLANQLRDIEELPIEYFAAQNEQLHDLHAVINFKLPADKSAYDYRQQLPKHEDVIATDRVPVNADPEKLRKLKTLGWDHTSLPEVRIFCIDDELYIGGECPDDMKDTPFKREQWMREVLRTYLPQDYIDELTVFTDAHGKPDNNLFKVELNEASQPVFKFPKSMAKDNAQDSARLVMMGDALRKSHYHAGSGGLTGLREAKAFGQFLKTAQTKKDWADFVRAINKLRDVNRERVDGYLGMRRKRSSRELTPNKTSPRHERSTSPVVQQLDAAYELLGIDRNPLYVCDAGEAMPRFEKAYKDVMDKRHGSVNRADERKMSQAARVIRDDLEAREFKATAEMLTDFTSRIHDENSDTCSVLKGGEAKDLSFSYVTKRSFGSNGEGKVFHFARFDLQGSEDAMDLQNQEYCEFRVDGKGQCSVVITENVGPLNRQIRGKCGLNIRVPHHSDDDAYFPPEISMSIPNQAEIAFKNQFEALLKKSANHILDTSRADSGFGVFSYQLELQGEEIDKALRVIHEQFCTNKNLTAEQFIETMRAKVGKKSSPQTTHSVSANANTLFYQEQKKEPSEKYRGFGYGVP